MAKKLGNKIAGIRYIAPRDDADYVQGVDELGLPADEAQEMKDLAGRWVVFYNQYKSGFREHDEAILEFVSDEMGLDCFRIAPGTYGYNRAYANRPEFAHPTRVLTIDEPDVTIGQIRTLLTRAVEDDLIHDDFAISSEDMRMLALTADDFGKETNVIVR